MQRISQVIGRRKAREVAQATGYSEAAISYYLAGKRRPPTEFLGRLAQTYQTDLNWLMLGIGRTAAGNAASPAPAPETAAPQFAVVEMAEANAHVVDDDTFDHLPAAERRRYRPVVAIAACGDFIGAHAEFPAGRAERFLRLPAAPRDPNAFAVELAGQSMMPAYRDGDFVVLAPNRIPVEGEPAVIVLTDDAATFKFWRQHQANFAYHLWAADPNWPARDVPADQVRRVIPMLMHLPLLVRRKPEGGTDD